METVENQSKHYKTRFFSRAVASIALIPLVFLALGRGTSPTTEGRMNEGKECGPHVTRSPECIKKSRPFES